MVSQKKVLITGISGWIAQFCAVELIKEGYFVRGSLRSKQRQQEVIEALSKEVDTTNNLEFCELDLTKDNGWDKAMTDCCYVLHVASPFVINEPKHESELIKPAVEGTLRALKAAKKANVKRVVLTSSIVAMFAHLKKGIFTPKTWTEINGKNKINSYQKSKTLAEKAAWEFIRNQDQTNPLELTVINPGAVLGPTLSKDISGASLGICAQLLTAKMPGIPNLNIPMVDVRDVAKHHLKAMTLPEANNKRFISAFAKSTPFLTFAKTLKENGYSKVPTRKVPTLLLKFLSLFDSEAKGMVPLLDSNVSCDNSETIELLNWKNPIPLEKTFLDMAKSVQTILDSH